ncbi:MAG: hypothetical protein AABZ32_08410, partial [Bacteroidota bacterium]
MKDKDGNIYLIQNNTLWYKSNVFGIAWGKKSSDIVTASIDPTDSKIIYVIRTSGGLVEKTIDGGKEWKKIDNGLPVGRGLIFGNPHNSQEVFLSSQKGLYKSSDKGLSWKETAFKESVQQFLINPRNEKYFYALRRDYAVFFSKDAGNTWNRVDNTLPQITVKEKGRVAKKIPIRVEAIAIVNYQKPFLLAFASDSEKNRMRLFKTENNGISWTEAKNPEPTTWSIRSIYVDDSAVFLGGHNCIYKSKDGINWEKIDLAKDGINEAVAGITKDEGGKSLLLATASGKILHIDDNGNLIGGKEAEDSGDLVDTEPLYTIPTNNKISATALND